jgi:hypothetical protein
VDPKQLHITSNAYSPTPPNPPHIPDLQWTLTINSMGKHADTVRWNKSEPLSKTLPKTAILLPLRLQITSTTVEWNLYSFIYWSITTCSALLCRWILF